MLSKDSDTNCDALHSATPELTLPNSVLSLIARQQTVSDRLIALESLSNAFYPSDCRPNLIDSLTKSDIVSDWRHSKLVEVTGLTKTLDREDGHILAICLSGLYADRYRRLF